MPKVLVGRAESIFICAMKKQKSSPGGQRDHGVVPFEVTFAEEAMWMVGWFFMNPTTQLRLSSHNCWIRGPFHEEKNGISP